ncbi:MAG: hypothetical protein RL268_284 [Pseudomonadota bacterium]|jgi:hypothetical protein
MDTEQFHEAVEAAVKSAIQNWSPQWGDFPEAIYETYKKAIAEALATDGEHYFRFADDGSIELSILPLGDSHHFDDPWFHCRANIADEVIQYAEDGGGEGEAVANAIAGLESAIARLKTEAASKGWDLAL